MTDEVRTHLLSIRRGMMYRTTNRKAKDWKRYGGAGVRVCDEWADPLTGPDAFVDWAKSHGYRIGLTIDRVDVHKGYEPGNCMWITKRAQAYNRKTNHFITMDGKTLTLEEWSRRTGIAPDRILRRMYAGWTVEEALKTPVGTKRGSREEKR